MKRQVVRPVNNSLQVRYFAGKNKQVFRLVRKSLQVREVVGEVISPRGIPTTTIVLREFMFDLLLKLWKGSGVVDGLLNNEGVYFPGWDRHVGNDKL
jgi:hypothetical protein